MTLNNKVFFLASDPARKTDEKNHLAANLNKAEIATASLRHIVLDFLRQHETVQK